MKRLTIATLGFYAAFLAAEILVFRLISEGLAGKAAVWGGLLAFNVFPAALAAGALHLRRLGEGEEAPSSGFWWRASGLIGAGLTLAWLAAANGVQAVAVYAPSDAAPTLILTVFLLGAFCARVSFWAVAQGGALLQEFGEAEA